MSTPIPRLPAALGLPQLHGAGASAPLVTRVVVAAVFLGHGLPRWQDPQAFTQVLEQLGVSATWLGWIVVIGEPLAAMALLVGLFSRLVSIVLIFQMVMAIMVAARLVGFMTPHDGSPAFGAGYELHLLIIACLFVTLSAGPGPFALDRVLGLEPAVAHRPLRPLQIAASYGLACGVATAVLAALIGRTILGMATMAGGNAVDHAISGGIAGFLAGGAAVIGYDLLNRRAGAGNGAATGPSAITAALVGGVIGAVVSALVNYAIIAPPPDAFANTTNHAVTGLISGFLAAFAGLATGRLRGIAAKTPVSHPATNQ